MIEEVREDERLRPLAAGGISMQKRLTTLPEDVLVNALREAKRKLDDQSWNA